MRRIVTCLLGGLLVLLCLAPPASAIKTTQLRVVIDVNLRATVRQTFDSKQRCKQGETASVTYQWDYESDPPGRGNGPRATSALIANGEARTGASLGGKRGAQERATEAAWDADLDDCIDVTDDTVLPPGISAPNCKRLRGRVVASIVAQAAPQSGDDDLTGISPDSALLSVARSGGGKQNEGCVRFLGESVTNSVSTVRTADARIPLDETALSGSTSFEFRVKDLGSGIRRLQQASIKEISRSFSVSTPCDVQVPDPLGARFFGTTLGSPSKASCTATVSGTVVVTRKGKPTTLTIPG